MNRFTRTVVFNFVWLWGYRPYSKSSVLIASVAMLFKIFKLLNFSSNSLGFWGLGWGGASVAWHQVCLVRCAL